MNEKYKKSLRELELSLQAINGMENSRSYEDLEGYWLDFLTHIDRAFNKMKAVCPRSGTPDKLLSTANRDRTSELLQYLVQARNSNEHGIEDITVMESGGIGIGARNPFEVMYIDHLEIKSGVITIGPNSRNVQVSFTPNRFLPKSVTNRGNTFLVPDTHLGNNIVGFSLSQIARISFDYCNNLLIKINENDKNT